MSEKFTYEEFKRHADNLLDFYKRYPELESLSKRVFKEQDMAMSIALMMLWESYEDIVESLAAAKRKPL